MSESDLRSRIKQMLVKNLMLQTTPDQIADDLPLFGPNGLGLDSIDALELVVSMEKTFGVGVPNSEVAGKALRTVNTIHDYILEKGSQPSKQPAKRVGSRGRRRVNRVNQLPEAAETAAVWRENQSREIPNLGLVFFLTHRIALHDLASPKQVREVPC